MKLFAPIMIAITLSGCATPPPQTLVKTEQIVIIPDKALFTCKNVRKFPNHETLTDAEVARLIVTLHKNNTNCQKNINSIYKVLETAKKTTEEN
jgi:hypothetical protein